MMVIWLVVAGTWLDYDFPKKLEIGIPTDELHHFSEGVKPPTSYGDYGDILKHYTMLWWRCTKDMSNLKMVEKCLRSVSV
jgi:hypothetical protein